MKRTINPLKNHIVIAALAAVLALTACGVEESSGRVEETHIEATKVSDETAASDTADSSEGEAEGSEETAEPVTNPCYSLSVPTQITKIGDLYFIVDCYNNQVIYNENITDPINEWKVMTSDISMGHTVAGDGKVYMVDDTENNRILVFEYQNGIFVNTQVFEDVGVRPHFVVYNEEDGHFYAWSSMTGQMYVFDYTGEGNDLCISKIMTIDELNGVYVRSFTIDGDKVYLVSGNSQIIEARLSDFKITNRYEVPDSMAGMIQIMPYSNGFYITVSTDVNGSQDYATIINTEKLSDLAKGKYTDIYSYFVGGGTPYYMGEIDGRYYLTEHRIPGHSVWSFDIGEDGNPVNVTAVY